MVITKTIDRAKKNYYLRKDQVGKDPVSPEVDDWMMWSMRSHSETEIRQECLKNINNICFTYICRFSKLSEEFIIEFMGLSTGVFTIRNYDRKQAMLVGELTFDYLADDNIVNSIRIAQLSKDGVDPNAKTTWYKKYLSLNPAILSEFLSKPAALRDRLDWYYIDKYQHISTEFRTHYVSVLNTSRANQSKEASRQYQTLLDDYC